MQSVWEHLAEKFPEHKQAFLDAGKWLQGEVVSFAREGKAVYLRLRNGELFQFLDFEQVALPQWVSVIKPRSDGVPAARQATDYREGQPVIDIQKQRDPYTGIG